MKKAAILAAGNGDRIRSISPYKPITNINGISLLELTLKNLQFKSFDKISIIFNENEIHMDLSVLPSLSLPSIDYFFQTTPSSMHSLFEVFKRLHIKKGEHLFVSMVDSIVDPDEAIKFHQLCKDLPPHESAIMATTFIDDESPLTLEINQQGYVTKFQSPINATTLVTSGVYYFSENVFAQLQSMVNSKQLKMRLFLTELIKKKYKIRVFTSPKTLDIDRPSDVLTAEKFLQGLIK